eukprot:TRINITY_DN4013_c0_g1_i2.p1 TRINITY_DN4013_c0_g1~~TRINITY_DN4013_c0_g1_i2.p1  ORF type:complete len:1227 (+),score=337.45 TRINITY_DN4013_c0_g1_i2:103-3681(+)
MGLAVPAVVLMLAAALVSTSVSLAGGMLMFFEGLKVIEQTVKEVSEADVQSVARQLNQSYQAVYEAAFTYKATIQTWQGLSSSRDVLEKNEKELFARINYSESLYSMLIASIPMNNTIGNPDVLYQAVWWDPLTVGVPPGTREFVAAAFGEHNFGKHNDACSTYQGDPKMLDYCDLVWAIDRQTSKRMLEPSYARVISAIATFGDTGTRWTEQQEGWREDGADWWRVPNVWYSRDGTPYVFASFVQVLPQLPDSVPVFGGNRKTVVNAYFTFRPWEEHLRMQTAEASMVATFLNDGHRSQVLATNLDVELMTRGCNDQRTVNFTKATDPCVAKLSQLPRFVQDAALILNRTHAGQFLKESISGGEYWLRRALIHPRRPGRKGELDEQWPTHLLWMRPVSSVEDQLNRSLLLFIIFVVVVFFFDVVILGVEVLFLAAPLGRLKEAMDPLEFMDVETALFKVERIRGRSMLIAEVRKLADRFREALVALQEFRRFLPQSVLVSDEDPIAENASAMSEDPLAGRSRHSRALGSETWSHHSGKSTGAVRMRSKPLTALSEFRTVRGSLMQVSLDMTRLVDMATEGHQVGVPVMRFIGSVLDAASSQSALTLSKGASGDRMVVTSSWNVLRTCPSHALRACETALVAARRAKCAHSTCTISVTSGTMFVGNVGNESQRGTTAVGRPVALADWFVELAAKIQCKILISPATFEQTRSSVTARVVDAVRLRSGEELLAYELLSADSEGQERERPVACAFSSLRLGAIEDARSQLKEHLKDSGFDWQVLRMYRLCMVLGEQPYLDSYARAQQDLWLDVEAAARDMPLPEDITSLIPNDLDDSPLSNSGISRQKTLGEAEVLKDRIRQAYANTTVSASELHLPTVFTDARGREYHRSDRSLGRGAFGQVWLGMGVDGAMVAVKSIPISGSASERDLPPPTFVRLLGSDGDEAGTPEVSSETATTQKSSRSLSAPGNTIARKQVSEMVQEVSLMTSLRHDNVVQCLGCAVEASHVLIIMEYLPGGSVGGVLQQYSGKLPLSCIKRFVRDIVSGLKFIHSNQIVHRDLKPANVLLTIEGQCKLADFGASAELKQVAPEHERGQMVGTPMYMAPEQAGGHACTASDIWSLGIILCELFTGQQPWGKVGHPIAFAARLAETPDLVPELPDDLTSEARDLAEKCLRWRQENRPSARKLSDHHFIIG